MIELKKLRLDFGFTQSEIANKLGISQQAYANYESGKRQPDQNTLIKIADIFDVSTDYLLGRTKELQTPQNENTRDEQSHELLEIFDTLSSSDKDKVIGYASALGQANISEFKPAPKYIIGTAAAYGGSGVVSKRTEEEDKEVSQILWDETHSADKR